METADLLDEVQLHTALYDPSHPGYTDASYKETIWKQISEKLEQPSDLCRTRWNNVRDTYRKVLKRRSQQTDDSAIRKYRYEDQLSFLTPFLTDKDKAVPRSFVDVTPADGPTEKAFVDSPKYNEMLIESVQINSHLYDVTHPKYNDMQTRNDTWKAIGEELELPGHICRLRWRALRNSYRKWLNLHSGKSENPKKHRYDESLSFLKPFLSLKEEHEKLDYENIICSSDFVEVDYSNHDVTAECIEDPEIFAQDRKRVLSPNDAEILRKRLCTSRPDSPKESHTPDGLSHFINTIECTMRQLTPTLLNRAKTDIFTLVQKYELELLEKNNPQD